MSPLKLNGSTSGFTAIDAPAVAGSNTLTLPTGNGTNGQYLQTNGSGALSWATVSASQWTTTGSDIYYNTGKVLVGTSTATNNIVDSENFAVVSTAQSANAGMTATQYGGTSGGAAPLFNFQRSRGTTDGSMTVVQSGDRLGLITFRGSDGSAFRHAAWIEGWVDGTAGSSDMPGRLVFSTTADGASIPTERMRITSSGFFKATNTGDYFGAGSSFHEFRSNINDGNALVVSHTGTSGNQYGIYVNLANDQNDATRTFLQGIGGSTTRVRLLSNGGLSNYQANNVNLSDINTKKDISPAADTWNCIKEWEIVNYRYKDQPDDADLNLGVIAQQVAESCPEVITVFSEATENEPEKLGVKEQQMYWMAIKALQEAQARIETLEVANADLAARLTALEVTP